MRDAGKVAMTPRGVYNEETTYEYLDIVLYGMSSWVAKKVTTGNPPEEGEYWQKIAAGTEEIINDSIVSGGNAWSSLKTNNLYKEQGLDFIESSTRENIQTGETHQSILGKVKRWFSDLKTVAFSGNYNDLSNKPTLGNSASKAVANNVTTTGEGSVLDARQGKVLKDEINQLNSNLLKSTVLYSGSRAIDSAGVWNETHSFTNFDYVVFTLSAQGWIHTCVIDTRNGDDVGYVMSFGYLHSDGDYREWLVQFKISGRYLKEVRPSMAINRGAFTTRSGSVYVLRIVGYNMP